MKFSLPSITSLALLMCMISIFTISSCKKDDQPNQGGPDCNIANADLSYTKNMKGIIDRVCLSCHSGSGPGPRDYRTYEGIKPVLDNGLVLERVVIKKDMPQSGISMSQAQRDSVNCWIKAGYPK
ncbi:MAG: hypothetical protein ABIQ93_12175 [Saprospiraceae bacterium]